MPARSGCARSCTLSDLDGSRPPAPRPDLALREGYHSPQVDVEVRLNTNESPDPPPQAFLDDLARAALALSPNRYPDREATALRTAVGARHGLPPGQVFCANGSNEVLQCLLLAYGGPGRTALVFEPTYALHAHIARLTSTAILGGSRGADFAIDLAEALALVERQQPDVVFICSPNNPTGRCESRDTIEAVATATKGLVIVDEAYGQFARWSAAELLGAFGNVAVVRTFSKTWALAALRLGYVIAHEQVVDACRSVALPYHLDALKQQAGTAALRYDAEMRARVARLVEERGFVEAELSELPVDFWPSEANFVLFRPRTRGAADVWHDLVDRSVLVRDVSGLAGLAGCLRVTIGTPGENRRFVRALDEVLATPRR
jgi:histidinol-phosphate aminotransferase